MKIFLILTLLVSCLTADITQLEKITNVPKEDWVQKGERWTFKDQCEEKRAVILPLLEKMGLFSEKNAKEKHYDYAIIPGALRASVETRIKHLVKQWENGVRFIQVVFLTGQRPLHVEKEKEILHLETETAMMIDLWESLEIPKEMRVLPLTVVDAPPLPFRGRPTMQSSVHAWLELSPKPGTILMVSNQPYVGYQEAVLSILLPSFWVEGIGKEGGRSLPLSVLLDALGKERNWKQTLESGPIIPLD